MSSGIERVALLAQTYESEGGDYLEHGPTWDNDRWTRALSATELRALSWDHMTGTNVTRRRIHDLWSRDMDEEEAVVAFVLTMVWGLGSHFLGPFKVRTMLNSRPLPDLGSFLLEIREKVRDEESSWKTLSGALVAVLRGDVKHLGPVYATKLLYAMSSPANRSPVLDVWVGRWGFEYGFDFVLNSTRKWQRNADTLGRFIVFCDHCLGVLTTHSGGTLASESSDRGFVEYLVFWDSKYRFRKRWTDDSQFPRWVTAVSGG